MRVLAILGLSFMWVLPVAAAPDDLVDTAVPTDEMSFSASADMATEPIANATLPSEVIADVTEASAMPMEEAPEPYEPYSLQRALEAKQLASKSMIDSKTRKIMDKSARTIEKLNIPQKSLQVGAVAPNFRLPRANGERVQLSDLLQKGPAVVNFYRGGWCPYCQLELQAYEDALPEIEALGASLVAISPETMEKSAQTSGKLGLSYPLVSDAGNETARAFGLVFEMPKKLQEVYLQFGIDLVQSNGEDSWALPVPAVYVIAQDGTVAARFVDSDYKKRMDPSDVIKVLESIKKGKMKAGDSE